MAASTVCTRVAPSPTGPFHIGTARAALVNYLFARHVGGVFKVRSEDTDRARSTRAFEDDILAGLQALGLTWDEFVRQSERVPRHRACLEQLIAGGAAYVSREPAKEGSGEVAVVRLRNPGRVVTFHDEVRGDIAFNTSELGDFVIARSLDDPLYHFAVVVDDADMGVTHVLRGEDHISNTPRQILIQEALDFPRPVYAHFPLILAPDRSKLSKRRGAVSVTEYLREGYLPEALVNFLALMGWNPGTEQQLFTLEELVAQFSLDGAQKSGAIFDLEKLRWLNREHRRRDGGTSDRARIATGDVFAAHPALRDLFLRCPEAQADACDRVATMGELEELVAAGEFAYYEARPVLDPTLLVWKKDPVPERVTARLARVAELLDAVPEPYTYERVRAAVWPYAEEEGRGAVLWSLRYALSGRERSPDPFLLLVALGRTESLARIAAARTCCV